MLFWWIFEFTDEYKVHLSLEDFIGEREFQWNWDFYVCRRGIVPKDNDKANYVIGIPVCSLG